MKSDQERADQFLADAEALEARAHNLRATANQLMGEARRFKWPTGVRIMPIAEFEKMAGVIIGRRYVSARLPEETG